MQNFYDIIEIVGKKKILVLLQGKVDIKLQTYMKIIRRRNCLFLLIKFFLNHDFI